MTRPLISTSIHADVSLSGFRSWPAQGFWPLIAVLAVTVDGGANATTELSPGATSRLPVIALSDMASTLVFGIHHPAAGDLDPPKPPRHYTFG
jgi:hypothetical protein